MRSLTIDTFDARAHFRAERLQITTLWGRAAAAIRQSLERFRVCRTGSSGICAHGRVDLEPTWVRGSKFTQLIVGHPASFAIHSCRFFLNRGCFAVLVREVSRG